MRIISRKKLKEAAAKHADAEPALSAWYKIAKAAAWKSLEDVRGIFPYADGVDDYTVFNIKGNTYRLIVKIRYKYHIVYIKHFLTHAEYSKSWWKE